MPSIKCFLGMLLVSFWFSSMFANTLLYPCSLATAKAFVACNGNLSLCGVDPVTTGLVSTQTALISHNRCSVKLPFFWKAAAVNMIVDIVHIKDCEELRGAYAWDELNIRANAPFPLISQTSVEMGGVFSEAWSIYSVPTKICWVFRVYKTGTISTAENNF